MIRQIAPRPWYPVAPAAPLDPRDVLIAPNGARGLVFPAYPGILARKPWEYRVSVCLPHLETPETLPLVTELLRLQTITPYQMVIDTGSSQAALEKLERLRAEDVEIHRIRGHGWRHSSEPVAVAMDLAMALCRTEYLFCTHTDVFALRRDWLEHLLNLCGPETPVVGWEMSDRSWITDQWQGIPGHVSLMLHLPTLRRAGVQWDMTRAEESGKLRGVGGGWPDTETGFGLCLQSAGVTPLLLGRETNFERQETEWWLHCRSYAGSRYYSPAYHQRARGWINAALREAEERAAQWREASRGAVP